MQLKFWQLTEGYRVPLLNFMRFLSGSFLQPVWVPLNCCMTIQHSSHSSLFCTNCRFAQAALCLIRQVINKDVKQSWPQCETLGSSSVLPLILQPVSVGCYQRSHHKPYSSWDKHLLLSPRWPGQLAHCRRLLGYQSMTSPLEINADCL